MVPEAHFLKLALTQTNKSLNKVSNPKVGAVAVSKSGKYYFGNNIFLSNCALSCAEANAFASAVSHGDLDIIAIYIANSRTDKKIVAPLTPCGNCRQLLHDVYVLTGNDIQIFSTNGIDVIGYSISDLLPDAFIPTSLS